MQFAPRGLPFLQPLSLLESSPPVHIQIFPSCDNKRRKFHVNLDFAVYKYRWLTS
jgi:hypothetical protein